MRARTAPCGRLSDFRTFTITGGGITGITGITGIDVIADLTATARSPPSVLT